MSNQFEHIRQQIVIHNNDNRSHRIADLFIGDQIQTQRQREPRALHLGVDMNLFIIRAMTRKPLPDIPFLRQSMHCLAISRVLTIEAVVIHIIQDVIKVSAPVVPELLMDNNFKLRFYGRTIPGTGPLIELGNMTQI